MQEDIKRVLRTAQTWAPWTRSLKFRTYNFLTRAFGRHVEPEFRLLAAMRPINLALDIGGNWGQSIQALRYYARPKKIITFEPNPPLAERLEQVHRDDPVVEVKPYGLAEKDDEKVLYTPSYRNFIFDGLTSFDPDSYKSWLTSERIVKFSDKHVHMHERRVEIHRLDDLHLAPDVVKMDVQGYEKNVLQGGEETFTRYRPFTILEDPSPDCVDFFAKLNMSSYVLEGDKLKKGETAHENSLFLTDAHVARLTEKGHWRVV